MKPVACCKVLLVCAAALLAACNPLTRESPVKQTFLLEAPMPAAVGKTHPATLRVAGVNVAAPFRGRTFVYRTGELAYTNDFYDEFLVTPAAMIAEQTARSLQSARVFTLVLPPGTGADADFVLEGFVTGLYVDGRSGSAAAAELTVSYFLTTAVGNNVPLWSHEYHRRVQLASMTAANYSSALNGALGEVLSELARDLSALDLKKP